MKLALLACLIALIAADQLIPLTKQEYGISIGDPQGSLRIEFFLDFACPDSKNSYFAWRDVWKSIDLVRQGVKLTFQEAPLQFHYYAFKLHVAFAFVKTVGGVNTALKYIDYIFTNQEKFTEEAFIGSTLDQFLDNLATSVATATGVNRNDLRRELEYGTASHYKARDHWKYTVGTHGISGAPLFNANSVRIDGADNYAFGDWVDFIKKWGN